MTTRILENLQNLMKKNPLARLIIFIVLVAFTLLITSKNQKIEAGSDSGVSMSLPNELSQFVGGDLEVGELELDILPNDTKFLKKIYVPKNDVGTDMQNKSALYFSIVLSGADRRSLHRPEICLVAQGWTLRNRRSVKFDINGTALEAMDLSIERIDELAGGEKKKTSGHYIYWWVGKDVSTAHSWKRILMTSWDNAFRGVNHRWAYPSVMIIDSGNAASTSKEAKIRIEPLLQEIIPLFQKSYSLKDNSN